MPNNNHKPVTRAELRSVLDSKLRHYPTKKDLQATLAKYATKKDLEAALTKYATKKDLEAAIARCASKEALNIVAVQVAQSSLDIADIQARMATKDDIADLRRLIEPFLQKIVEHDERLGLLEHKVASLP